MPSIKEIYNSIGEVELNAESINLNVDGLEALASTQQADIALIKADVDDIRIDLANGVTINQPVAITDNSGSLTVDGTITANAGTGTFSVSDKGATGESTVSSFTSTTSSTLKSSNSSRKLLTIYNEGAGNLHVLYGSGTASTTNYSVRLSTGDYLEIEKYTGQVNAIFATAGTARVTEIT